MIAVGEAADHCMYVRQINDTLAYYWQLLEQKKTTEEIIVQACEEYDAPAEVIKQDVQELIRQLYKMHYLLEDTTIDAGEG